MAKPDFFFEVSWEVCNKVGGIYTVVTSKILPMQKIYGKEFYYTIGPYFENGTKAEEFKEKSPRTFLKEAFEKLHNLGIRCHYGTWRCEGEPETILIDYSRFSYKLNDLKGENWKHFKIDSLNTQYHDYDEPILWSTAVGILLEELKKHFSDKILVAQLHEWMSGGAILHIKANKLRIGTVFTTHATILGRTLAGNHIDLYGQLGKLNPDENAVKFGIQAKHLTEKACAQNADVFTTVSEITGMEAGYFLGKKPDVVLPNGLNIETFPTFDEASIKHKALKAKVKKFLTYYFFPYYQFDMDNTLCFFLAGRYEFHDKGIDVFIKALGRLNEDMRRTKSEKTIVAFIFVPAGVKEIRPEILQSRTYFNDFEDTIHDQMDEIKDRMVYGLVSSKELSEQFLLGDATAKDMEKKIVRFNRTGSPPFSTHILYNEQNDEILNGFKSAGLLNAKEDKVKVILYPVYLTGADQLLDLTYYESIMACHLGVFPSYYEPWGYTPMETGALGVASVTTNLAGFGRYIEAMNTEKKYPGIFVIERLNKKEDEIVDSLFRIFKGYKDYTKQERIDNKLQAKKLADSADWKILVENYIKAHNMAAEKNS